MRRLLSNYWRSRRHFSTVNVTTIHDTVLTDIKPENIRNFSIIAHVDHGKSSLSDRLMEFLGNISPNISKNQQVLDTLKVEKERGITVKAQTVSMIYTDEDFGEKYLLNLIDTPGHYDFSFEVARSLNACQGVLFLVDSSQGLQAQTYSTFEMAQSKQLAVLPVLTKIDVPFSNPESVIQSLENVFALDRDLVCLTSAKTGAGIYNLVKQIIKTIPPPIAYDLGEFAALIIDTWFSPYDGVTCLLKIDSGSIRVKDKVKTVMSKSAYTVKHICVLTPSPVKHSLGTQGMVITMSAGINSLEEAPIGSTVLPFDSDRTADFEFIQSPKPMIFSCLFPEDGSKYDTLKRDLKKLILNDASVDIKDEISDALGPGFRCGFVGKLHLEVFIQRLRDEYYQEVVLTPPTVPITVLFTDGTTEQVSTPKMLPDKAPGSSKYANKKNVKDYLEPFAKVIILGPAENLGEILEFMVSEKRSEQSKLEFITEDKALLEFYTPLEEVIDGMVDKIKSLSSGKASFDYKVVDSRISDIQKVDIYVSNKIVESLSFICHRSKAILKGKVILEKLKNVISRKQFEVILQAKLGSKIICRETIRATRKDVLNKSGKTVGGGDMTRKMKLLEKQKRGKKQMKQSGKVDLSQKDVLQALYK